METAFIVKLVLSFVVGSVWITLGTVLAEKYGTKVGGLVAGLPSTILVSLFFIAWTQSPRVAVDATTIVPIIGGINCLFIVTYVVLLRANFVLALTGAVLVWFVLSFLFVYAGFSSFPSAIVMYILSVVICHHLLEKRLRIKSKPGKRMHYTPAIMIYRGLFSGFIIVTAVVLAKVGGPLLGGTFAMFPAMFIGTLFITYFTHGASFSAAVMKSSIVGAISVVIFGTAVRFTYLPLGLWLGTIISVALSFGSSIVIHRFLARRTV
jgi:hypothetical protein